MYSGLILLVVIAVIVAWFWNRGRRRLGLRISGGTWTGPIIVFVLVILLFWASSHHGH
jgi:hypothetical protein